MSNTYDKVCYVRAILAEIFFGWRADWEAHSRQLQAAMVTDCKSLKDLTAKAGSLPAEKCIALDIADVRQGLEAGDKLFWTSTDRMAVDALTKSITEDTLLTEILCSGYYDFRPTEKIKHRPRLAGG